MNIISFLFLFFYGVNSFFQPPKPQNIINSVTKFYKKNIIFVKNNIELLSNVTRRVKERKYEILDLIFTDKYNETEPILDEIKLTDI